MYKPQRTQSKYGEGRREDRISLWFSAFLSVPSVVYILFFSLSSCSFRDYTNELKQLDSTTIIISTAKLQLQQVDTNSYLFRIKGFQKALDSLKQYQAEHDTLALVLRSQYLKAGKTCIAIVQETRRLNKEAKYLSEQVQKLKSDLDKQAYDEQSAKEYAQAESNSAKRLAQSVNKFMKVQGEEEVKIENVIKK